MRGADVTELWWASGRAPNGRGDARTWGEPSPPRRPEIETFAVIVTESPAMCGRSFHHALREVMSRVDRMTLRSRHARRAPKRSHTPDPAYGPERIPGLRPRHAHSRLVQSYRGAGHATLWPPKLRYNSFPTPTGHRTRRGYGLSKTITLDTKALRLHLRVRPHALPIASKSSWT